MTEKVIALESQHLIAETLSKKALLSKSLEESSDDDDNGDNSSISPAVIRTGNAECEANNATAQQDDEADDMLSTTPNDWHLSVQTAKGASESLSSSPSICLYVTTGSSVTSSTSVIVESSSTNACNNDNSNVTMTTTLLDTCSSSIINSIRPTSLHLNSPPPPTAPGGPGNGEHVVMVHVNAGETFSVRVGDQIQHIPGPATVRMVSNHGPPMPMPMQAPPGHMIQQIVDEQGILTHVILSPHPGLANSAGGVVSCGAGQLPPGAPPTTNVQLNASNHIYANDAMINGSNYPAAYAQHYPSFSFSTTAGSSPMDVSTCDLALQESSSHHIRPSAAGSILGRDKRLTANSPQSAYTQMSYSKNSNGVGVACSRRQQQQHLREYRQVQQHLPVSHTRDPNIASPQRHRKPRLNGDVTFGPKICTPHSLQPSCGQQRYMRGSNQSHFGPNAHHLTTPTNNNNGSDVGGSGGLPISNHVSGANSAPGSGTSSEDELCLSEEEATAVRLLLDSLEAPKVTEIESRSALIILRSPETQVQDWASECRLPEELDPADFNFELNLSETGPEGRYTCVFRGEHVEILLRDLKPAQEYFICASAFYGSVKGKFTLPVNFCTLGAPPQCPATVQMQARTKNTLSLRWLAPEDNGAKITAYLLEWNRCDSEDNMANNIDFQELYKGSQRQFKVTKLLPSTQYNFRVSAINQYGQSEPSEAVMLSTCGLVPMQPEAPILAAQGARTLTCVWQQRPSDVEFILQMEDEATGHGFISIFHGKELSHEVTNLRRNTQYKFRLQCSNEEGSSKWSSVVAYHTLPDRPAAPQRLQLRGSARPYALRLCWEPPLDDGGSVITGYLLEFDRGSGYQPVYEGIELEYLIEGLTPGTLYRARAFSRSAGGESDGSDPPLQVYTLPVVPGQCTSLKLEGRVRSNSLQVSWRQPEYDGGSQVISYELWLSPRFDSTEAAVTPQDSSGLAGAELGRLAYCGREAACTVAGLTPGASYTLQVRAINRIGSGPWSKAFEVTADAGLPDAPDAPTVVARNAQVALLNWTAPKCNGGASIQKYRLEWQPKVEQDFSLLFCGEANSYELRGLSPATLYHFRVAALNSAGCGPFSLVTAFTSPPGAPGVITQVRATSTSHSVTVRWTATTCNDAAITAYNIQLGESSALIQTPPNVLEYTIDGLPMETTYKVRVQAVNMVGVGPFSTPIKIATCSLPPSPPRLECVQCQATSLRLKWGDGRNREILDYIVEMTSHPNLVGWQMVYSGTAHSHKVSRLSEMTKYSFRICAKNEAGTGAYSTEPYVWCTIKATPPAVRPPRIIDLSVDSCHVEWMPLRALAQDQLVYMLQLLAVNEARDADYRPSACEIIGGGSSNDVVDTKRSTKPASSDLDDSVDVGCTSLSCHYKEVYRDTKTSCKLTGLSAGTEYQVRVAAIRICQDSHQELLGTFSQSVAFTTRGVSSVGTSSPCGSGTARGRHQSGCSPTNVSIHSPNGTLTSWWRGPLSEQQLAAAILALFGFIVALVALLVQHLLET